MRMLDNPIFFGREAAILAEYANVPENEKNAILFGDWYIGDNAVYDFERGKHIVPIPFDYSPYWRHVLAVDPAGRGLIGIVLIAEHPMTGIKYVIYADYIKGKAPTLILDEIETIAKPYNIVKHVSDPHETWFIEQARLKGFFYHTPFNKTGRKVELIKQIQSGITDNKLLFVDKCTLLIDELASYQWSDSAEDKIAQSTKYHIMDALQYGWDLFPRFSGKTFVAPPKFDTPAEQYNHSIKMAVVAEREKRVVSLKRSRKSCKLR